MENGSTNLLGLPSIKNRIKYLISGFLSRFEPANNSYERRLLALESKWSEFETPSKNNEENRIEDKIYKDFELRFRGSSELITQRLKERYEHRLKIHLQERSEEKASLLDLGCGHGELLDVGKQIGFTTIGVDQSSEAIASCKGRGHQTIQGDLLNALQGFKDNSIDFISYLHVIEHCSAEYTIEVFKESNRCLAVGGIFLVETPSLYSLWASSRQFYLDPSHIKPVHPDYIQFVAGSCGFKQGEIREFGKVQHPEACDFNKIISALGDTDAAVEIRKLDKWLYGPMDLSCTFKK
ncbi:MAG: class I SAM-dependent methyltransferase [Oligoflexales bacterium]